MQIKISTRHGSLKPEQQDHIQQKAHKLLKYFDRLMEIEVTAEHSKNTWNLEILISAEHKHDFVAHHQSESFPTAVDQCVHKMEQQLRKYKDRLVDHRGDVPQGGTSPTQPDLPEPPAEAI